MTNLQQVDSKAICETDWVATVMGIEQVRNNNQLQMSAR